MLLGRGRCRNRPLPRLRLKCPRPRNEGLPPAHGIAINSSGIVNFGGSATTIIGGITRDIEFLRPSPKSRAGSLAAPRSADLPSSPRNSPVGQVLLGDTHR